VVSANLLGAKYDNETQWPRGFAPPDTTTEVSE
jgi:hypothetical protein